MDNNLYLHKTHISSECIYVEIENDFIYYDEDGEPLYDNYFFTCNSHYDDVQPIQVEKLIERLQFMKDNGANYVTLFFHEDHQEYEIDSFLIKKSSDEEIKYYLEGKLKMTKHSKDSILERHKKELEDFERYNICPPEA